MKSADLYKFCFAETFPKEKLPEKLLKFLSQPTYFQPQDWMFAGQPSACLMVFS